MLLFLNRKSLALLTLSTVAFLVVRGDLLDNLDKRIGGLTHQAATEMAQWLADKRRLTSALRLALDQCLCSVFYSLHVRVQPPLLGR